MKGKIIMDTKRKNELTEIAREIRVGIIDAVHSAKSGHPGGSLSIADVLTYLYFEEMNIDPKNPKKPDRDRLVLSKGHCHPVFTPLSRTEDTSPSKTSRPSVTPTAISRDIPT